MLGLGEPCVKKTKCDQQKVSNKKRKEKPQKPQFSLNFQFGVCEEEEMRPQMRDLCGFAIWQICDLGGQMPIS